MSTDKEKNFNTISPNFHLQKGGIRERLLGLSEKSKNDKKIALKPSISVRAIHELHPFRATLRDWFSLLSLI